MKIQKISLLNPIKAPKFNGIQANKDVEHQTLSSTNPIKSYPVEYYAPITFKANPKEHAEPTFDETIEKKLFSITNIKKPQRRKLSSNAR